MASYSINDLEKITGIKAHTIRIWEKRYNVVCPKRTPTNIRFYQDCDIKKLLNIATLNRHGFKISRIVKMSENEINEKILEITSKSNHFESQINNLVVATMEFNEETFELILSRATLKLDFENTITNILFPFLEKLGILWQIGTIFPAQEHFVSNLMRQKIILAIDGQIQNSRPEAKTFLLFLPEGELHELPLLFYNYIIRKHRMKVIYLGQSVPVNDIAQVNDIRKVDYLFTSFMANTPASEIPGYLEKLTKQFPDKKIFISGFQLKQIDSKLPPNVITVKNNSEFKKILQEIS